MGENVVSLTEAKPMPNEKVVAHLEQLLEDARRGEVVSIVVGALRRGGDVQCVWEGSEPTNPFTVLGIIDHMGKLFWLKFMEGLKFMEDQPEE